MSKTAIIPIPDTIIRPYAAGANLPHGSIHVKTYKEYQNLVAKWASGKLDDTLVVIGSAGIGKSEQAMSVLGTRPHCYVKGQATRYGVYLQLLSHINQPVVLDDVDVLLQSKEVTGLLKMLLETRNPKTIQWTTGATMIGDSGIPASFSTRSRTMILCNELKQVSKNFSAVLDRATLIWFAPSAAEIHKYAKSWVKDKEVYGFVGDRIHATPSPSCRFYYHGQKWKQAGLSWKKMIEGLMLPAESKAMMIRDLETKFNVTKERVAEWKRKTGETEQAYHATRRAVLRASGVDRSARAKAISEGMKRRHAARKAAEAGAV